MIGSCIAMVVFIALLHLDPFRQLAPIYDVTPMALRISAQQQQGKKIAIYPAKFSNQFQFPGRLTHTLFAVDDLQTLKSWLKKNPDGLVVMIAKKPLPSLNNPLFLPSLHHLFIFIILYSSSYGKTL